jgi:two-component system LytT family response regulator
MVKVIIVDDEIHAREKLTGILDSYDNIEIVAGCRNGLDAINKINSICPDLVFLDIEMPVIDGFQIIDNIECTPLPYIIFVTAYSEYAVKAFEIDALDYIHKPIDSNRLEKSLERYFNLVSDPEDIDEYEERVKNLVKESETEKPLDRFIVKKSGEYFLINDDDVLWIESDGNYIRIVTNDAKYFVRHTLTGFEKHLDSTHFFRISRSVIININWIRKIEDHHYGNYMVQLKNDIKLKMSKNYKGILEKFKSF